MRTLFIAPFASVLAIALGLGCQSTPTATGKNSQGSGDDTGAGGAGTGTGTGGASTGTGGGSTTTTTSTTSTGTGGAPGCSQPADCPGPDTECRTRTCVGGVCGESFTPAGTPLFQQMAGDCQKAICDGSGAEAAEPDDTDVGSDGNDCTTDGCSDGSATNTPLAKGSSCDQNGGSYCDDEATCVECLSGADCASGVCDGATSKCTVASCQDGVKNAGETDVDCGGAQCGKCAPDEHCVANDDCVGGSCVGGSCAPTCTDGVKNGAETDVDCGGGSCPACVLGQTCGAPSDCSTGACAGTCTCAPGDHLVLSEIRSRGVGGASDDFVEVYNPTAAPITLDKDWKVEARSASAASYSTRFTGSGQVVPAHGHLLLNGSAYAGAVAGDAKLSSGITDAASVRLTKAGSVVDAVCFYFNATTLTALTDPAKGYSCEGAPVSNLPHNDQSSAKSNVDQSLERRPGGAGGSVCDTGDSSADWQPLAPAAPQNAASAPTP